MHILFQANIHREKMRVDFKTEETELKKEGAGGKHRSGA